MQQSDHQLLFKYKLISEGERASDSEDVWMSVSSQMDCVQLNVET